MRTREEINNAPSFPEAKMLEVLLDCRDLLVKLNKKPRKTKKRVSKDADNA